MTDAFKCDRCGDLFGNPPALKVAANEMGVAGRIHIQSGTKDDPVVGGSRVIRSPQLPNHPKSEIKQGDLCESCANAFREFWGVDD